MTGDTPKLLADDDAREARRMQLREPHIAPLTDFVCDLRGANLNRAIPDFDPWDGGVNATILYLLEAPGPMAIKSGFVSRNNPDETAKNFHDLSREAGVPRTAAVIWNIVPWYIGSGARIRPATRRDIDDGLPHLMTLLDLLPKLRGAVLIGRHAQRAKPEIARLRPSLQLFNCPHPSPQFLNRAPKNRALVLSALLNVARDVPLLTCRLSSALELLRKWLYRDWLWIASV